MMALAWTYFPPTCWMTLAYWLSAPTATMVPALAAPDAGVQAVASRATPRADAAARTRCRMTDNSSASLPQGNRCSAAGNPLR